MLTSTPTGLLAPEHGSTVVARLGVGETVEDPEVEDGKLVAELTRLEAILPILENPKLGLAEKIMVLMDDTLFTYDPVPIAEIGPLAVPIVLESNVLADV